MIVEDGVVAGNVYDKYNTKNPIARYLVNRFLWHVEDLVRSVGATDIHEVGCGEGYLSTLLARCHDRQVRGSDFSSRIIQKAMETAQSKAVSPRFKIAALDQLRPPEDSAQLIVCCEVLEHVSDPILAINKLSSLANPFLLVSVPREPLWRVLNMMSGRYWKDLGNTPGHIHHWSTKGFLKFLSGCVDVLEIRTPLPWTIALCRKRECQRDKEFESCNQPL